MGKKNEKGCKIKPIVNKISATICLFLLSFPDIMAITNTFQSTALLQFLKAFCILSGRFLCCNSGDKGREKCQENQIPINLWADVLA